MAEYLDLRCFLTDCPRHTPVVAGWGSPSLGSSAVSLQYSGSGHSGGLDRRLIWLLFPPTQTGSTKCIRRKTTPGSRLPTPMSQRTSGPWVSPCEPWGRLLHLGRLEEGDAGGNAGGKAKGKPLQQASIPSSSSPPPSTCLRPPCEDATLASIFGEQGCCCPSASLLECKESLAGSAGLLRQDPPAAWVSGPAS